MLCSHLHGIHSHSPNRACLQCAGQRALALAAGALVFAGDVAGGCQPLSQAYVSILLVLPALYSLGYEHVFKTLVTKAHSVDGWKAHQRARCLQTVLLQYSLCHSSVNLFWLADVYCAPAQCLSLGVALPACLCQLVHCMCIGLLPIPSAAQLTYTKLLEGTHGTQSVYGRLQCLSITHSLQSNWEHAFNQVIASGLCAEYGFLALLPAPPANKDARVHADRVGWGARRPNRTAAWSLPPLTALP